MSAFEEGCSFQVVSKGAIVREGAEQDTAQVATLLLALHNLVGKRGPPGFVPAIKAAFALTFMYTRFWVSDPSLTSQTLHRHFHEVSATQRSPPPSPWSPPLLP